MDYIKLVNNEIEKFLPESKDVVSEAMKYSVRNGGKRIRPILVLEFCRLCGGNITKALPYACAIEFIHSYSLIHDDLPCMDNDDMRRGKPACHIAFGEANALLAGDGLLTLAFETLSKSELPAKNTVAALETLSKCAGASGMVMGQTLDLINEGKKVDIDNLKKTDLLKTGELIKAACVLGCIAADAEKSMIKSAEKYAENIGLAFQIVDDILDITSDSLTLGKPIGSDEGNAKSTYVALLGIEKSKEYVLKLTTEAKKALSAFGKNDTSALEAFADKLVSRTY